MLWSQSFIPTLKETPVEAETTAHKFMLRAGLVRMLTSGVYSYLPLGLKVLRNIENIIREEVDAVGAQELLLPALQPLELWKKTGRDAVMEQTMIKFKDRRGRDLCLGPTHEEVITDLVKNNIASYRDLPIVLYQIQTKFRDEPRPRFGLMRSCEFIMKDAYSFDRDIDGLNKNYEAMLKAYKRIFSRCGLDFVMIDADAGVMGGSLSHEFMVPGEGGEDQISSCLGCGYTTGKKGDVGCPKCRKPLQTKTAIEIGHVFQLGTKYTQALDVGFLDEKGKKNLVIMGCYGIGVSRLIPAIIEQNHDKNGVIWPAEVSPYQILILPLDTTQDKIMSLASKIYHKLNKSYNVLFDDRDQRAGVKFKDAALVGIPLCIILGKENAKTNSVEIEQRKGEKKTKVKVADLEKAIKRLLK